MGVSARPEPGLLLLPPPVPLHPPPSQRRRPPTTEPASAPTLAINHLRAPAAEPQECAPRHYPLRPQHFHRELQQDQLPVPSLEPCPSPPFLAGAPARGGGPSPAVP